MQHRARRAGFAILILLTSASAAAAGPIDSKPLNPTPIDPNMHHLRWGAPREWTEFPQRAEGPELILSFDSTANPSEKTLRLRHRDLKQVWTLRLNDREIARLPQDEDAMVTSWPIPAHVLRDGHNEMRITCPAKPAPAESDDIEIGEISLLEAPLAEAAGQCVLDVTALDADRGTPIPARLTLADERGALVSLGTPSDNHLAIRPGVVYTADGKAHLKLPAGRYVLYAGRGFAYSLATAPLDLRPGETKQQTLRIRRVVDTPGYVAADTHVHTFTWSRHGDATITERMITLAGEGVELPIATDHNFQIDYDPTARQTHTRDLFTPVIGNEVTTGALGHFNVFPIPKDAKLMNFRAPTWASLGKSIHEIAGPDPVVILNHARDIHGGFRPFDPSRHISLTGEDLDGWTGPANAMEVINSGATRADPMELYHDWFGMLNAGHRLTPIGASDSHDVSRYIVGQGRTYVRCDASDPGCIDVAQAVRSFREGRVLVSYGLLADIIVAGRYGPGELVPAPAGELEVQVRVVGPEWTRATHVTLYANGFPIRKADIATPAGSPEPTGVKWQATWTVPHPAHDLYLVAIATGPGIDKPYWPCAKPYQPTSPDFTSYVLGSTGPVYIDADSSGRFDFPHDYATRIVESANGELSATIAALADYDVATAAQAAMLLRQRHASDDFDRIARAAIADGKTASPVRRGFEMYLDQWATARTSRNPPRQSQ